MTDADQLTPRERQIAPLLADGLTYAQIGLQLGIARSTVKVHVARMADRIPDDANMPAARRVIRWWRLCHVTQRLIPSVLRK